MGWVSIRRPKGAKLVHSPPWDVYDTFPKECCERMCFLPEFELFILSYYMVGADLVEEALRDLLACSNRSNPSSASGRLGGAINRLSLIKRKGMWECLTDNHIDRIVYYCFPPTDREELAADWAREQVGDHSLELLAPHQEEEWIDLDKAIIKEASMNSLKRRRNFTFKFLLRKQIEYGERETKMRTLNKDSTVLKDKEERRDFRASISMGVQEEEGSGNHRPPPRSSTRALTLGNTDTPQEGRNQRPLKCKGAHPERSM